MPAHPLERLSHVRWKADLEESKKKKNKQLFVLIFYFIFIDLFFT